MKIGIVGQISPHKGHDDALEVLRLVPELELLVFGGGTPEYIASLMEKSVEYNISDRIRWCGMVDGQENIYPHFDVLIVPSKFDEPFGMVAAEAALFGKPVVAYRRGGLPEIIVNGETGFLVDTIEEMAEKLRLLL